MFQIISGFHVHLAMLHSEETWANKCDKIFVIENMKHEKRTKNTIQKKQKEAHERLA